MQQEELQQTKEDHALDLQLSGYEDMKEDTKEAFDNLTETLTNNAAAQEEIVSQMLGHITSRCV